MLIDLGQNVDVNTVDIRPARSDELAAVAALRWRCELESRTAPASTREEFTRRFVEWVGRNTDSHQCLVAVRDATVIGMAWLAVTARVPMPHSPKRASGDVQSVYIVPEERANGVGGRLVTAVLALAREAGLERVTVHSSSQAVSVYARSGFAVSPKLLQATLS